MTAPERRNAFIYQRSLEQRADYQPPARPRDFMSPKEVREFLGCSSSTVAKLRNQGDIVVSHRVGTKYMYDRASLEEYKGLRAEEEN